MFGSFSIMKAIRITALVLLIQTITWVILMGITTASIEPGWESPDYVHWAAEKSTAYVINYINVSLLTLVAVILFSLLYGYVKDPARRVAFAGLILVPVYGVMNLVCYGMQISLVPALAARALAGGETMARVSRLIQANPDSLVGYLNGLAYAILGVPSILYGILLYRRSKKWSGALFMVNGVLCIFGIIGYAAGSKLLSAGTILGGIAFLLALAALVVEFRPGKSGT